MLRFKKVHKSLIFYTIATLTILSVISKTGFFENQVLETILEYENYTWSRLSDEIFTLSAYYENRPLATECLLFPSMPDVSDVGAPAKGPGLPYRVPEAPPPPVRVKIEHG